MPVSVTWTQLFCYQEPTLSPLNLSYLMSTPQAHLCITLELPKYLGCISSLPSAPRTGSKVTQVRGCSEETERQQVTQFLSRTPSHLSLGLKGKRA